MGKRFLGTVYPNFSNPNTLIINSNLLLDYKNKYFIDLLIYLQMSCYSYIGTI